MRQHRVPGQKIFGNGLLPHLFAVNAAAVVADLDDNAAAALFRAQRDDAVHGLARALAFLGCFNAVIGGIADHVHDRIAQLLDHGLVDFGILAGDPQDDFLVGLLRKLAHQARHAVKYRADGLRPDRHHAVLQVLRVDQELRQFLEQPGIGVEQRLVNLLGNEGLRDGNFAGKIDQPVNAANVNPDGRNDRFSHCELVLRRRASGNVLHLNRAHRLRRLQVNGQVAIAFDELEHIADCGFAFAGFQLEIPAEIGFIWLQVCKRRQSGKIGDYFQGSQFLQLAHQQQGLIGPFEQAGVRGKMNGKPLGSNPEQQCLAPSALGGAFPDGVSSALSPASLASVRMELFS